MSPKAYVQIITLLVVCAILAVAILSRALSPAHSFDVKEIDRGYSGGSRAWLLVKVTNTGAAVDWIYFSLRRPQWTGLLHYGYGIICPDGSQGTAPMYMTSGFFVRINFTYTTNSMIYDPHERFQIEISTSKPYRGLGVYDIE